MFAPLKTVKPSKSPMWFNSEIHDELHKLHSLRKIQKRPNSAISSERVDLAKSPFQNQMVKAKCRYESKLVNDLVFSNNSESYSYLRGFPRMTLFLQYFRWSQNLLIPLLTRPLSSTDSFILSSIRICLFHIFKVWTCLISCSALLLSLNWILMMLYAQLIPRKLLE